MSNPQTRGLPRPRGPPAHGAGSPPAKVTGPVPFPAKGSQPEKRKKKVRSVAPALLSAVPAEARIPSLAPAKARNPSAAPAKASTPSAAPAKASTPSTAPAKASTPSTAPSKASTPSTAPSKAGHPSTAQARARTSPAKARTASKDGAVVEQLRQVCPATETTELRGYTGVRSFLILRACYHLSSEDFSFEVDLECGRLLQNEYSYPIWMFLSTSNRSKERFGTLRDNLHKGSPEQRVACVRQVLDDIAMCVLDLRKQFGERVCDYALWFQHTGLYLGDGKTTYAQWVTDRACTAVLDARPMKKIVEFPSVWVWGDSVE